MFLEEPYDSACIASWNQTIYREYNELTHDPKNFTEYWNNDEMDLCYAVEVVRFSPWFSYLRVLCWTLCFLALRVLL